MKNPSMKMLLACSCLAIVSTMAWAAEGTSVKMSLMPSGAMEKLGGYRPQMLKLSTDKPADLKKAPAMTAPLYGQIHFGDRTYLIALDEPQGKDAALYVDSNGNGDLTDDPKPTWETRTYPTRDGRTLTQYMGHLQLPLQTGNKSTLVSLGAYRFDKNDPQRAQLKDVLLYFADYAVNGQITLAGKTYESMLADENATGNFKTGDGVLLLIDVNADSRFSPRGEMFDAHKPFNIKGTTYELADLTPGGSFMVRKSTQTVAEVQPPPDLSVGQPIPSFKATTMDGKAVNFPADYKGKIVMLDFWATWCGPCMMEVPGLVKAYNQSHPKGFDVLGISLDQPNAADKVKSVTAAKGMSWPQVYDGKFWHARIAEMYGIQSIPAPFLVDGDSGKIIASGAALRGENLEKTLETALAKKSRTAG